MRGVREPLDLEKRLANLISDDIVPRLVPELEILPWRRTHVVAMQVHPSPSRPHYMKREGLEGGTYARVASTNRRAETFAAAFPSCAIVWWAASFTYWA